jgi:hypothetical protein
MGFGWCCGECRPSTRACPKQQSHAMHASDSESVSSCNWTRGSSSAFDDPPGFWRPACRSFWFVCGPVGTSPRREEEDAKSFCRRGRGVPLREGQGFWRPACRSFWFVRLRPGGDQLKARRGRREVLLQKRARSSSSRIPAGLLGITRFVSMQHIQQQKGIQNEPPPCSS